MGFGWIVAALGESPVFTATAGNNPFAPAGENAIGPGKNVIEPAKNAFRPGKNVIEPGKNVCRPGKNALEPGKNASRPGKNAIEPGKNVLGPGPWEKTSGSSRGSGAWGFPGPARSHQGTSLYFLPNASPALYGTFSRSTPDGNRWNDLHDTNAARLAARAVSKQ